MYLLYAPKEKFGLLPPNKTLISDEVKFTQNVAYCPKQYWQKLHLRFGCRDISPRFFKQLRLKRDLKTILLFATGGIGDTMWSMPFARALNEKYPKSNTFVVTEKHGKPVWDKCPYVRGTVENAFWNVAGLVANSDEVYDFSGMASILKQQMRLDPVEATFQMAGWPLPKDHEKLRPRLTLTLDEGRIAEKLLAEKNVKSRLDTIITIGIEASTSNRSWPFDYTIDLTNRLLDDGFKVVWLGKSPEFSARLLPPNRAPNGVVNLVAETNIRQAMALISLSDLYIGPNSGLMVIATSLLVPTLGLFGAFNPKLRAKYYARFTALWGKLDCAPCGEHWTECRHGHPAPCMKSILPSRVYSATQTMLKEYPRSLTEKLPLE